MKTKAWVWRYSKSPLGTGEFHLMRQGDERVWLVVRTVNKSAFTDADWDEFEVTVGSSLSFSSLRVLPFQTCHTVPLDTKPQTQVRT